MLKQITLTKPVVSFCLVSGLALLTGAAFAGECPPDQVGVDVMGAGATAPDGVTDEVLAAIDLADTSLEATGRNFRLRQLVIQPGGVVPWHSHADRPAIIYIVSGSVTEYASTPWMFLLMVNFAMLALGCFIEPVPALILAAPLLVPLASAFRIDLVHLGLIMTCNLAIGLYTPPVGGTLMVGARLAGVGMASVVRALLPQMAISVTILMIITYVPSISMGLVRALR